MRATPASGRWRVPERAIILRRPPPSSASRPPVSILDHRPRSVSELIDAAIAVVRRHFARYALIAACCVVPAQVAQSVIITTMDVRLGDPTNPDFAAMGALALVAILFVALAESALAIAVARSWEGHDDVDVGAALRGGLARWIPAFLSVVLKYVVLVLFGVVGFVAGIAIMAGVSLATGLSPDPRSPVTLLGVLLVMVIGGLTALPAIGRLAVVPMTAILERRNPVSALRRSYELTRGYWKHAVGASALAFLIVVIPYIGASLLAGLLGQQIVEQLVGVAVSVVLTPVYVASLTALYYDLRIRKEGFDLEVMASRLATAVPDAGPDVPATGGA
jgi:hypothetical protein